MRILVIEDEPKLGDYLKKGLEENGYVVDIARDGIEGRYLATEGDYALILLDVMLPGIDGFAVLQAIRRTSNVPVLVLTARDKVEDRVNGLQQGADDYLVKPFSLLELAMRLGALVRRAAPANGGKVVEVGGLKFDTDTLEAERDGVPIKLNPSTRSILGLLIQNTHRVVKREELEQLLWKDVPPQGDVLRAHMHALRNAIDKGFERRLLHTIHGTGYRLYVDESDG